MKVLLKIIFIFLLFPIKTYAFENPKVMKNEMADAKLDITVRPGGNYTLSLESKKKQEAVDAEKALAQK